MQFLKTDFAKQVLGNPKLSLSLYVPSNLAGLFGRKKKFALGQQFSKILKGSEKHEAWECCNQSAWLRLTEEEVLPLHRAPPLPVLRQQDLEKSQMHLTRLRVYTLQRTGPAAEMETF